MSVGYGSLWVAAPGAGSVSRVDLEKPGIADSRPGRWQPGALAVGGGSVWVASALGDRVRRVDPGTGAIVQTVGLNGARAAALAFGAGRLWIGDSVERSLIAVNPTSGRVERTLPLRFRPSTLALGDGTAWVADYGGGSLAEVDLQTGKTLSNVHVGGGPTAVAVAGGAVWVANALDSTVVKVDAGDSSPGRRIPVGSGPTGLADAGGSLWVASQYSGDRVPDRHGARGRDLHVTGERQRRPRWRRQATRCGSACGRRVAPAAARSAWCMRGRCASTRPSTATSCRWPPIARPRWARRATRASPAATGPNWCPISPSTCPHRTGGTDVHVSPAPGVRYSDGRPLSAPDFRRALERVFRVGSWAAPAFEGVLGARVCTRARCDLSAGIVADEAAHTVTFRLRDPDPDFPAALALAPAAAVPPGTPMHDAALRPIPGTGPYMVAAASASEIRYERNPFFREWSHAAQPDGNPDAIVTRLGMPREEQVRLVEQGRADATLDGLPTHGSGSCAPGPGPASRGDDPDHGVHPVQHHAGAVRRRARPPRAEPRSRPARDRAAVRRPCHADVPGPARGRPRPPAVLPVHPQPGPAVERAGRCGARRLVAASGTRGQRVTLWSWTDDGPEIARYYVSVLRRLGYRARVKLVSHTALDQAPESVYRRIQLIPAAWGDTPQGMFQTWFACDGPNVHGWFCDRRLDRWMARAQQLDGHPAAGGVGVVGAHRPRARRPGRVGADRRAPRAGLRLRTRPQLPVPPLRGPDRRPALAGSSAADALIRRVARDHAPGDRHLLIAEDPRTRHIGAGQRVARHRGVGERQDRCIRPVRELRVQDAAAVRAPVADRPPRVALDARAPDVQQPEVVDPAPPRNSSAPRAVTRLSATRLSASVVVSFALPELMPPAVASANPAGAIAVTALPVSRLSPIVAAPPIPSPPLSTIALPVAPSSTRPVTRLSSSALRRSVSTPSLLMPPPKATASPTELVATARLPATRESRTVASTQPESGGLVQSSSPTISRPPDWAIVSTSAGKAAARPARLSRIALSSMVRPAWRGSPPANQARVLTRIPPPSE